MPKKKTEAAQAAPSKSAKKPEAKPTKRAAKVSDKPTKSVPTRKYQKHVNVSNETVLATFAADKPMTKSEIVAACGGDVVAVTKTIRRLRTEGKIVTIGEKRNTTYRKT